MGALNVGRISLEVEPAEWSIERGVDTQSYSFRGFLLADSQETTQYIRNELMNQHSDLVAITWDTDDWFNGYYYLTDVRVETTPVSYMRRGLFPFEISLYRVGGYATTELQSLVTSGDRLNDFGTTPQPWHAVPVGTLAYDAGPGNDVVESTRETEDGTMAVYYDIDATWDPSWSVDPADYYNGAVEIYTQDVLRTGRELPGNDPTDWYMTNGLIEVRSQTFQGTSNGRFEIRPWDGSAWDSWIDFKIVYDATHNVPEWHYMTIVKNKPEACVIKLVRDAATVPPSAHRHTLDFLLRRGSPFVECIYSFSSTSTKTHRVGRDSTDAANRPSGASYIHDATAFEGHRWILGAPFEFTENTTEGYITMDDARTFMPFFVGFNINAAANDTGNGVADMTKQYTAPLAETVRAVRR